MSSEGVGGEKRVGETGKKKAALYIAQKGKDKKKA
jgi:hypothetical protein